MLLRCFLLLPIGISSFLECFFFTQSYERFAMRRWGGFSCILSREVQRVVTQKKNQTRNSTTMIVDDFLPINTFSRAQKYHGKPS